MTIDTVQPALTIQAKHPKQDGNGQSGQDSGREGKSGQPETQDQPQAFLNDLGQLTGKTINITA